MYPLWSCSTGGLGWGGNCLICCIVFKPRCLIAISFCFSSQSELESIQEVLGDYRACHGTLIKWIEETTAQQEMMKPGQAEDSRELSEQLSQQTVGATVAWWKLMAASWFIIREGDVLAIKLPSNGKTFQAPSSEKVQANGFVFSPDRLVRVSSNPEFLWLYIEIIDGQIKIILLYFFLDITFDFTRVKVWGIENPGKAVNGRKLIKVVFICGYFCLFCLALQLRVRSLELDAWIPVLAHSLTMRPWANYLASQYSTSLSVKWT